MAKYFDQSFVSGEFLTPSKLNQLYENIDVARRSHESTQAPNNAARGVWWLDRANRPWILKIHDGTTWVPILQIDAVTNQAAVAGDGLISGTISSGSIISQYVDSGAITDLIMQDSLITTDTRVASGAVTDHKVKLNSITSTMVDSGAIAVTANIANGNISEDQCAHSYATVSGNSSGVSITLNEYAMFPCIEQESGDTSVNFEVRCRTGSADASTPGFRLVRSSAADYSVQYRYFTP